MIRADQPGEVQTSHRGRLWAGVIVAMMALTLAHPATPADSPEAGTPSRVVFVGDSVTAGVGVSAPSLRYSSRVVELLRGQGQAATEVNLGKSGQALCQQPEGYATEVLQAQPDVLVVQWGVNDHFWGYSVAQFAVAYDGLVSAVRAVRPEMPIVLTTLIPDYRYPDTSEQWLGEANVAIQEVAARYGCHLADLHRALDHHRDQYYADIIHPNDAGTQVMAEAIVRALAAAPLSPTNLRVAFDHSGEVRFMQNVFLPASAAPGPHWVEASAITAQGMTLSTEVPLTIRTAPIYPAGTYRIAVADAAGAPVATQTVTITWEQMLQFQVDPQGHPQPLTLTITAPGG